MFNKKNLKVNLICLILLTSLALLTACGETITPPLVPMPTLSATTLPATLAPTRQPIVAATPTQTLASPTRGQTSLTTSKAIITKANGDKQAMSVELARTSQEQSTGLMNRTTLPEDGGMLFVFGQPILSGFWMKDTVMALSIAFIDAKGNIIDIQDMQPLSEDTHAPNQAYVYALEVPQGYFSRKGIKVGDTFTLNN